MLKMRSAMCGYGGKPVVEIPHLDLDRAAVMAVVGRSGAGKSTLLATLSGTLPLMAGSIAMDGAPTRAETLRRDVARTLQSFPLLHWLTVRENLLLAAKLRKKSLPNADAVLSRFSAAHLAGRYPKDISGGERARASLAQAAVSSPKVLLLDEPLTGLDPVVKAEVAEALFSFARAEQAAVLFVTHDLADAIRYAGSIAVLSPGATSKIISVLPTTDVDVESKVLGILRGDQK